MKITKAQLKQIIKEELNKDLSEGFMDFFKSKKTKAAEAAAAAEIEKINAVIEKLPTGNLNRGNLYYVIKTINDANMPKEIGRFHRALNALEKEEHKQASQLLKNLVNNVPKVKDLLPRIRLGTRGRYDVFAPISKPLHPDEQAESPDGDSGAFARSFAKGVGKGARGAFRTKVGFSALEENNLKISRAQLIKIIEEELNEVYSEKQRRYMCAMKDADADERPEGLSQKEAEEQCKGPMKKKKKD